MSDNGGSAGQSSAGGNAPAVFPSYLEIKGWCGFRDRNTHGLTEAQATKLRQGVGPDLESGSCESQEDKDHLLPENTKPVKLGPQRTTPFVTEEKPAWRQEQRRTFGESTGSG